jgi:hypothetical protein
MIYKLTGGLAGWLAQHCTSIVLCPPNNTQIFAIYKLTDGLQGYQLSNIIFNTKLLILNIYIVQFNYIKLLKDVKYLI